MPNLNAALGCAQSERLGDLLEKKREIARRYQTAFQGAGATVFQEIDGAESNYWLNTLMLPEASLVYRDEVLQALHDAQVLARPAWNLLHRQKPYADAPRMPDLSGAEDLVSRIVSLPSGVAMLG